MSGAKFRKQSPDKYDEEKKAAADRGEKDDVGGQPFLLGGVGGRSPVSGRSSRVHRAHLLPPKSEQFITVFIYLFRIE